MLKKKILVVDDDPISLLIFTEMFKNEFDIYYATSSHVAIDLVSKIYFDGYILDLYMGDNEPNGVELLGSIKTKGLKKDVPFIAMSASNHPQEKKNMLEAGFTHFCQKPIQKIEIIAALL